jgi:hypothetical protein
MRFSYYARRPLSSALQHDETGAIASRPPAVVSYGVLFRDASAGEDGVVWRPGARSLVSGTNHSRCAPNPGAGSTDATVIDALATTAAPCATQNKATRLLAGARSGFRDGQAELAACGATDRDSTCADRVSANILPINIDVHALHGALAAIEPGELGSYFCAEGGPCLMGRPFNGILYVAAPWISTTTESEVGYGPAGGGATPPPPLPMPTTNDADQPGGLDDATITSWGGGPLAVWRDLAGHVVQDEARDDEVSALPFPMCSYPEVGLALGAAGQPMNTDADIAFRWPDCGGTFTQVNAVRVINARRVNTNLLPTTVAPISGLPPTPSGPVVATGPLDAPLMPQGLTIATNLPLYVVGDVNTTSEVWGAPGTGVWSPVLMAGDTVTLLSNAWDDARSRWGLSAGSRFLCSGDLAAPSACEPRRARVTRSYMQILAGAAAPVVGNSDGGVQGLPRVLEDWSSGSVAHCGGTSAFPGGCPQILRGALVNGFYRVHTAWGSSTAHIDIGGRAENQLWGFDRHLGHPDRQPPGSPLFDVSAIQQWARQ